MHKLEHSNDKPNKKNPQSHLTLVDESTVTTKTEMNDICNRIQTIANPTKKADTLNYKRVNSNRQKNEIQIVKCVTQESQASSVMNSKPSNHTKNSYQIKNSFIDNISVDNYIDFNLKSVHSIFNLKKDSLCLDLKQQNVEFNLSTQNMLNNSQQSSTENIKIITKEKECSNNNVKENKECCPLKMFIYIFILFVVLIVLLLITALILHFLLPT